MSVSTNNSSSHAMFDEDQKFDLCGRGLRDLCHVDIPSIAVLLLSNNELTSFAGLRGHSDLEVIQADNNQFESIDTNELSGLRSLTTLILGNNTISKIGPISALSGLKVLDLSNNRLSVVENLEGSRALRRLNVSRNRIHSVFLKTPIKSLTMLDLRYNVIDHVDFSASFPNLVSLHLDHCYLASLAGLSAFKSLKRLTLSFNKIRDREPLKLPALEYLNISNNNLDSLEIISNLSNLVVLDASFNGIDDASIESLVASEIQLKTVRVVNLAGTNVTRCGALARLFPNAEVVDLAGSRVTRVDDIRSLVGNLRRLHSADFRFTPITADLYPDTQGATVNSRSEYKSIDVYDSMYQDTAVLRAKYRKQVLSFCGKGFEILDGITVTGGERAFLGKSHGSSSNHKRTEELNERVECDIQTMNSGSDTDAVMQRLQSENARLKRDKEALERRNGLIEKIRALFEEQAELRNVLNLSELRLPDIENNDVAFLEELAERLERENGDFARLVAQRQQEHVPTASDSEESSEPLTTGQTSEDLANLAAENERLKHELLKLRESSSSKIPQRKQKEPKSKKPHSEKPKHDHHKHRHQDHRKVSSDDEEPEKKVDTSKLALIDQLMAENALLRDQLGLDPLQYKGAAGFADDEADNVIAQLLDHNKIMREQANHQEALLAARGPSDLEPYKPEEQKRIETHDEVKDLVGSKNGCNFWVGLKRDGEEEADYMNKPIRQLPICVVKKPKSSKCIKSEELILKMSRVPPYPPESSKIEQDSSEFGLVETWITSSLNRVVKVEDIRKSNFFWKIIENERTMSHMHLVVFPGSEAQEMIANGVDHPIIVADHMRYVLRSLASTGECEVMIGVFDGGNEAVNYCEHTAIPNSHELRSLNREYDSLRFQFEGDEAIVTLNPSRLVPLYSAKLISKN